MDHGGGGAGADNARSAGWGWGSGGKEKMRVGAEGGLSAGLGVCMGEVGDLGEARGGEGVGGGHSRKQSRLTLC